jgi:hypothetical protein
MWISTIMEPGQWRRHLTQWHNTTKLTVKGMARNNHREVTLYKTHGIPPKRGSVPISFLPCVRKGAERMFAVAVTIKLRF